MIAAPLALLVVGMLHWFAFSALPILGVVPQLTLIVYAFLLVRLPLKAMALAAIVVGYVYDLYTALTPGSVMISFWVAVTVLIGLVRLVDFERQRVRFALIVICAIATFELMLYLLSSGPVWRTFGHYLAVQTGLSVLITLAFYSFFKRAKL